MKRLVSKKISILFSTLGLCAAIGCSTAYYGAMEKLGYQKRDILVSRVDSAKTAQKETKEQFASALDAYLSVVTVKSGELESRYRTLAATYDDSKAQAEELADRIDAVESVAKALFKEWESEIKQYSNRSLAAESRRQLQETKQRYRPMIAAMRNAESKVEPVLVVLNDQVLFLKHNLNARSIRALQGEVSTIKSNVSVLVAEMERAIAESESFIKELEK